MQKLHGLILALVGAFSLFAAEAAETAWEVRANTMDDADVRTEGRCLYAYTPSTGKCMVNGVVFASFPKGGASLAGDVDFGEVSLNFYDGFVPSTLDWTGGAPGKLVLLKNGWYYSYYNSRTYNIVLKGLEPGKRHLVQFWVCDARSGRSGHTASVGSVYGSKVDANGIGVNFTGVFVAGTSEETIAVTFNNEALINAIQVRCLDAAKIEWTAHATSGALDVRTDGVGVYAYKAMGDLTVNGVQFKDGAQFSTEWGENIKFSLQTGWAYNGYCDASDSVPEGAYSYSDDYRALAGCGFYGKVEPCLRRDLTLRKLQPGLRYLVQIWNFDNRDGSHANRTVLYDNSVMVANSADGIKYGHGSYVVGEFTATAETQTIGCYARHKSDWENSEEMLGAIQVRCLDRDENVFVCGSTAADGSVDVRGRSLYAFAVRPATVAGVDFRAFKTTGDQYGDVAFAADGEIRTRLDKAEVFLDGARLEVAPAVSNLLAGALYRDDGIAENEVRLNRLVPGRRYLVQAWFADTRANGYDKYVDFGGAGVGYVSASAPLGQYVTGVFRATNATHSIVMNKQNMQINSLQVRELDSGVASRIAWQVENTAAGETSVATEGTLKYAYAPVAFQLDNGVAFSQGAAKSTDWGGVALNQPFGNSHTAFGANGQTGAIATLLNNGWYQGSGSSADYTFTLRQLEFGHAYLVQLFVADLRGATSGTRRISIYGQSGRYGNYNDDAAPYGSVCTGRFVADADTFSFQVNYDGIGAAQLNAIHVRDLGSACCTWIGGDGDAWTADGDHWRLNGEDQTGVGLWKTGSGNVALLEGDVSIDLGEDVSAQMIAGSGNLEIGKGGSDKVLTVAAEVSAPLAKVNAVWGSRHVEKTMPGTTVLAGAMPNLAFVNVANGRLVLSGAVGRAVNISVAAPGELGFGGWRELAIASLSGDGTLVGPGGIVFADGEEHVVPTSPANGEGFAWRLANGSSIALADGADASRIRVRIDEPREYGGRVAVRACGRVSGKPEFVLPSSAWTVVWDAELSGWKIGNPAYIVIR